MESSSFVTAFNLNGSVLYTKVDWMPNEIDLFHIQIYEKQNWWTGRFSKDFADKYRIHNEENADEYKNTVKAALMKAKDFAYEFVPIQDNPDDSKFSWKKVYQDEEVGLPVTKVHGCVPVHKDLSTSNDSLIEFLLDENCLLKKNIEDYEMNILVLNGELEQSRNELEKFMHAKNSLEMTVFGKFINLLNNKKRRIKMLEHSLQELDQSAGSKHSEVD